MMTANKARDNPVDLRKSVLLFKELSMFSNYKRVNKKFKKF